jgi:hypothetical protein
VLAAFPTSPSRRWAAWEDLCLGAVNPSNIPHAKRSQKTDEPFYKCSRSYASFSAHLFSASPCFLSQRWPSLTDVCAVIYCSRISTAFASLSMFFQISARLSLVGGSDQIRRAGSAHSIMVLMLSGDDDDDADSHQQCAQLVGFLLRFLIVSIICAENLE